MKILLWLDDKRDPFKDNWLKNFSPLQDPHQTVWLLSYDEFTNYINSNGLPDAICFDHDLGLPNHIKRVQNGMSKRKSRSLKQQEKTGYDCAKWLVEYCMDNELKLPLYNIQSSNPVGKDNIDSLLKNFIKHCQL
jgi:hypothetical protein